MITCPRCGFEQPKDVFCAKCGVNMDTYVSQNPPFQKKLADNAVLISVILILLAGGLFYIAYSHRQQQITEEVPAVAERQEPVPTPAFSAPPRPEPTTTAAALPPGPKPQTENHQIGVAETKATPEPSNVEIDFTTLTRDTLYRLPREGEGHLEIGRYSMATFPQFKAKYDALSKESGFKVLSQETRSLTLGQPSLVFRGGKEPKSNETIGFFIEVTPVRQTEKGMEIKVSVKRSLPDISPTGELKVVSQNFDESLSVPHNGALAMAGLLPRKILFQGEEELYKSNVLKVFLDPEFQKGDEEFVIWIAPRFNEVTN